MTRTIFFYDLQRGITQKLRKGEQSFVCVALCLDLIYIFVRYHQDILKIINERTYRQRHAIIRPNCFQNGLINNSSAYLDCFISTIGYCLDIAIIDSCYLFNTNAKKALNLG